MRLQWEHRKVSRCYVHSWCCSFQLSLIPAVPLSRAFKRKKVPVTFNYTQI